MSLLLGLELIDCIRLGTAILAVIPAVILRNYYIKTRMTDFILVIGIFITGALNLISAVLIPTFYPYNSFYLLIYLLIFIHALRVKWQKPPPVLLYIGVLGYFGIESFILLNQFFSHDFINILLNIYRIYALILLFWVYSTTPRIIADERIETTRNLFLIAAILHFIYPILRIGNLTSFWTLDINVGFLFDLFSLAVIAYIFVRYPETAVLSHAQFLRIVGLYEKIQSLKSAKEVEEMGMSSFIEYIQKVRQEVLPNNESN